MIGILAAAVAALFGGTAVAHRLSGVSRSARRARGAVRENTNELQAGRRELSDRKQRVLAASADYTRGVRERIRAETPIEELRELGASHVRWTALRGAGVKTLDDLRGRSERELDALPGVGEASAGRLLEAARLHEERLSNREPDLPDEQLVAPGAAPLVRRADDFLAAQRELGAPMAELEREQLERVGRLQEVRRGAGYLRWAGTALVGKDQEPLISAANQLAEDAEVSLKSGAAARLRAARQTLAAPQLEDVAATPELRKRWRTARAELASVLDMVLAPETPEGVVDSEAGARLPEEIVAAVGACALRTEGLALVLRRYQHFGARYVVVQERTILGDDMGLGKTIQALAAMVHLSHTEGARHMLVVAPATVVPNWLGEIARFSSLATHRVHGPDREEAAVRWLAEGGVAVSSYSTLRTMKLAERLGAQIDVLIADEAHFLKNPEAARTQAVADLLPISRRVCLMTGTPLENSLDEFRQLLRHVRPDLPEAQERDPDVPEVDPARFEEAVASTYLRRNQRDVLLELPDRIEKQEWVELDARDRSAYAEAVSAGNIMAMRRAATVGDWSRGDRGQPDAAKLRRLVDIADEHFEAGRKLLVFSYFLDVLDALGKRLPAIGTLHGGVSPDERAEIIDQFSAHEGPTVLLAQITAAGVGLNLQAASVVILAEPQWKPSIEDQAIARAHRMGQTEKVVVHRLLAADTVDERIVELLADKREVFERYARDSLVKEVAAEATEASLSKMVVETERARLAEAGELPETDA